jgi:phosphoribosylformimino-5-aminoimidazole carboxamide ribonucleotide (ProFAR) isomerase
MKIIPAIDLMEGKVVRLYKGDPDKKTIYSDNPLEVAKKWESAGADMIHLVDLDATLEKGSNFEILRSIAKSVKIPVQVAGGLRNEKIIEEALGFAQRAVIGTLAFKDKTALWANPKASSIIFSFLSPPATCTGIFTDFAMLRSISKLEPFSSVASRSTK